MKPLGWMKRSLLLTEAQRRRAEDPFTAAIVTEIERLTREAEEIEAGSSSYASSKLAANPAAKHTHTVWFAVQMVCQDGIGYVMGDTLAGYVAHDLLRQGRHGTSGMGEHCNARLTVIGQRLAALLHGQDRDTFERLERDDAARKAPAKGAGA